MHVIINALAYNRISVYTKTLYNISYIHTVTGITLGQKWGYSDINHFFPSTATIMWWSANPATEPNWELRKLLLALGMGTQLNSTFQSLDLPSTDIDIFFVIFHHICNKLSNFTKDMIKSLATLTQYPHPTRNRVYINRSPQMNEMMPTDTVFLSV